MPEHKDPDRKKAQGINPATPTNSEPIGKKDKEATSQEEKRPHVAHF
jgi:hypothetical protein